jgi:hypothetical protein
MVRIGAAPLGLIMFAAHNPNGLRRVLQICRRSAAETCGCGGRPRLNAATVGCCVGWLPHTKLLSPWQLRSRMSLPQPPGSRRHDTHVLPSTLLIPRRSF